MADMSGFERLWFSTMSLHRRFNLLENNIGDRRRKLSEEFVEFIEASIQYELHTDEYGSMNDFSLRENVVNEFLDFVVVGMSILQRHGIQFRDIDKGAINISQKNDNKTDDTHVVYNGMITKRSKLMEIRTNDTE